MVYSLPWSIQRSTIMQKCRNPPSVIFKQEFLWCFIDAGTENDWVKTRDVPFIWKYNFKTMQLHHKVVIETAKRQSQRRIPIPLNYCTVPLKHDANKNTVMQISYSPAQNDILRIHHCPYHGLEFHCFSHWAKTSS